MLGNFEKALEYFKNGLRAASSINHLSSLGVVEAMFGLMFIIKGDGTNAIKHFQNNSEKHFEGASWAFIGRILGKADLSQSDTAAEYIDNNFFCWRFLCG
jgi:hypothetical protein